ncbi:inositol monophosphatase family protein [Pseudonocardia asaccharolytica]|uniref:Inositol-1-monophosphatase n=1 Tax=Pseudonocardia asaccharolytica DSM 44247 = NBRC 16224 TaxID=1123024 RepID=A0A511CZQ3_9PSEU|nr:inositol monophosphatase family protein [Pseudonocardia asaccharolytica]GEL18030.1 inositol monophosphatase [Pseudonocardia asaccharolytica DSM 44247 = NBRC 16224]
MDSAHDDPTALRRTAEQVAGQAAEHLRELRAEGAARAVRTKTSPTDVVTAADTALENLVRTRLAELRPGEIVYGEEAGGDPTAAHWVVDPIDGTVNYLYGLPWYAVSVAAVRGGEPLAGAVVEPASGRVWSAAVDGGATLDGTPLRVGEETELAQSLIGTGFSYRADRRARQARMAAGMLPRVRDLRRAGSAALDLCAVAAGWLDGYLEHGLSWYDWAAAGLIAREAGAVVRVPGPPGAAVAAPDDGLGADAVLAAAPGIAGALTALARDCGAGEV